MVMYYFELQWKRWKRLLLELSIHPAVGVMGSVLLFVGLSELLFLKLQFATPIFVLIGTAVVASLGEEGRVERLHLLFNKSGRQRIRLIENILVAAPFALFLLYKLQIGYGIAMLLVAIIMAFIKLSSTSAWTMPTPFRRLPFEFTAGFRRTALLLIPTCLIAAKAIQVDNYNLGMAAMMLPVLISLSFYSKPEHVYFVWIFDMDSKAFLFKKLRSGLLSLTIFVIPLFIVMVWVFPERVLMTLGIMLVGMVFLTAMLFAKYSAYPLQLSLPQAILLGLSLWFPPLLLLVIPIFYLQSKKRLQNILS